MKLRLLQIILCISGVSVLVGCTQPSIPTTSVLGTDLFLTQTSSNISYELHVSEPAKVSLTLDREARSTEMTLFECSTISPATSEKVCVISGMFDKLGISEQGTLSSQINLSDDPGTNQIRAIRLQANNSGRIDFNS
ncbi:MAG: hypothetical protein GFH27_549285n357 [Chloroflexi bacterium AL-W]|nr:hypothetical protein [Chloroflexi bacterium AL-N1]NOK65868.1 hypothetical protein [Chloroflexi bacterium AL-N10]NOK74191.1 hypothetical protein [Chloroflexi bacterium AL-N5]NOK80901.1 hypothetical protein [Chloroflexi bacterium AL-W]NOK88449.1 hypothetical protein [Chloroflexi bacterium AL-N15]